MNNWTECTWIEAANAFAAGTHEVEWKGVQGIWMPNIGEFRAPICYVYRIREKSRTITVTIALPLDAEYCNARRLILQFPSIGDRDKAVGIIRAAMSEQP